MGLVHSPKIVTDGLVLALDAGNVKSYPGSGTTWFDKSGNGNNGALANSPTFTGNSFTDFLTDEYIDINAADVYNYMPTGTADRTIVCTFKTPSSFSNAYYHMFHYGTPTTNQAYGLAIITTFNNFASFPALANHTWAGASYSNYELSTNTIYIGAVRFKNTNSPKNNYFINGEFPTTLFGQGKGSDYNINTGTSFKPRVGTRIPSAGTNTTAEQTQDGEIYQVLTYNRYLSDQELIQNYNATKSRFGL